MSVPHASEDFRDWLTFDVYPGTGGRYWVGDAPRLSSKDEAVSYGRITESDLIYSMVGVVLVPFTPTANVQVSSQARIIAPLTGTPEFELFVSDLDFNFYAYWSEPIAEGWQIISQPLSSFTGYDAELFHAAAISGAVLVGMVNPTPLVEDGLGLDVSWIDLSLGQIPLRLRQRGDGLGMGGPRLFGRGSRQRSPRARGYL